MEIRNRGKRRCQFKDGDSILHNDRISGDNNPRSGGDVKVQINTLGTVISLCEVLNVSSEWLLCGKQTVPDSEKIATKISSLSNAQLAALDRVTDELLHLLKVTEGSE